MSRPSEYLSPGLHHLLQEDRSRPRYDVRKHPEQAVPEFDTFCSEPALLADIGPTPRMIRIIFEDPGDMPWTIDIRAKGKRYITLEEVLIGIYDALHERVSPSEFALFRMRIPHSLFESRERQWKLMIKERRRTSAHDDHTLLRVDWLRCYRGPYFVSLRKNDSLAQQLLLPGMGKCEHTYVARFSSSEYASSKASAPSHPTERGY